MTFKVLTKKKEKKKYFLDAFKDQKIFAKEALSQLYDFLFFAGDIRSGKTIICLTILVLFCKIYPGSRWAVIRRDRPTLVRNTLPTFFKWCCPPKFIKEYNKSDLFVTMTNGSQILFMSESIKDDPELNRFKGLEVNGFFLNQVEELQRKTFDICVTRRDQWKLDKMPPGIILADCNPTSNWVKVDVYDAWANNELLDRWYFQEADWDNNPYLTEAYKASVKAALTPDMYRRFCEHNWEAIDEIMQLTPWDVIHDSKRKLDIKGTRKFLGVDVGHDGPDPSVWIIGEGTPDKCNIISIIKIDKTKIPEVTQKTEQVMLENNINAEDVCIDVVGLGAGVGDELEEKGYSIIKMKGGLGCQEELVGTNFTFSNLRTWSHWTASKCMKEGRIGNFTHRTLVSDCGAIKYGIKQDKNIYIESKEEFRKRTGRSSDFWDAYTYMVWSMRQEALISVPGVFGI